VLRARLVGKWDKPYQRILRGELIRTWPDMQGYETYKCCTLSAADSACLCSLVFVCPCLVMEQPTYRMIVDSLANLFVEYLPLRSAPLWTVLSVLMVWALCSLFLFSSEKAVWNPVPYHFMLPTTERAQDEPGYSGTAWMSPSSALSESQAARARPSRADLSG